MLAVRNADVNPVDIVLATQNMSILKTLLSLLTYWRGWAYSFDGARDEGLGDQDD